MARLLTARAHAHRIAALRKELTGPAVVIGPTRAAADALVRDAPEPSVFVGVRCYGQFGLALELATPVLARKGLAPLLGLAAEALVARALDEVRGELERLTPVARTPGLPGRLAATLGDLRRAGVARAALEDAGPTGPDLGRILAAYERLLAEGRFADETDVLEAAAAAPLGSALGSALGPVAGLPQLWLDVAPQDRAEAKWLASLFAAAPSVVAAVGPNHPGIDRLAPALGVEPEPIGEPPQNDALGRARQWVFSSQLGPQGLLDPSLRFVSAPGEAREAVEIARGVLRHASNGVPFDRMAVLLRDPERYQPHLVDALGRAGIAAHFARDLRQPDPAGRALLNLLACAAEDLSAARFAEYLSLGEVPTPDAAGAPPLRPVPWVTSADPRQLSFFDLEPEPSAEPEPEPLLDAPEDVPVVEGKLAAPYRWEQLLVEAAVVGGRDRWARRLRGLAEELKTRAAAERGESPHRAARAEADLAALGHLERFALPLVDRLAKLPRSAPWTVWIEALEGLATAALRAPARVLRVLSELRVLGSGRELDLEQVRVVLRPRLAFLREEDADEEPGGKLFVAPIDAAFGRSFKVVFLPGLAERLFPRPVDEDPLLPDEDRARLDPALPCRPRRAAWERARLRAAIGAAESTLEASYPRIEPEHGRPRALSFYALDLLRAAEGQLLPTSAIERRATQEAAEIPGWRVPSDPKRAIDGAEFDVSVLATTSVIGALPGAGHYLLSGHPHLPRVLRARAGRWRRPFTGHDGLAQVAEGTIERLAKEQLDARPHSASGLGNFAVCPYRFFLSAVVRLRPREEAPRVERMDPIIRGNLIHDALRRWVAQIDGAGLLPWTKEGAEPVLQHLRDALLATAAEHEERIAPAIGAVWRREVAAIGVELEAFVRRELADRSGFSPAFAELAFGLSYGDRDPASVPDPVLLPSGVLLRGSVDLVERHPKTERLRVTDYKSGRRNPPMGPERVRGGRMLQPLLYAEAVEAVLGAEVEAARLAHPTARGGYQSDFFSVGPAGRAALAEAMAIIKGHLARGFLPAAPQDRNDCSMCDFRPVCGPDEGERGSIKDPDAQADLVRLRGLP